jgi:TatA/E family protein of Tat protein translocase
VFLLILDSLGGTELLVILVVALVIFGPRKLPELSRSLGRTLADFKRASHDFKETWEKEARLSDELKETQVEHAMLPPEESRATAETVGRGSPFSSNAATLPALGSGTTTATEDSSQALPASAAMGASLVPPPSVRPMPADSSLVQSVATHAATEPHPTTTEEEPTRKQDWL